MTVTLGQNISRNLSHSWAQVRQILGSVHGEYFVVYKPFFSCLFLKYSRLYVVV